MLLCLLSSLEAPKSPWRAPKGGGVQVLLRILLLLQQISSCLLTFCYSLAHFGHKSSSFIMDSIHYTLCIFEELGSWTLTHVGPADGRGRSARTHVMSFIFWSKNVVVNGGQMNFQVIDFNVIFDLATEASLSTHAAKRILLMPNAVSAFLHHSGTSRFLPLGLQNIDLNLP